MQLGANNIKARLEFKFYVYNQNLYNLVGWLGEGGVGRLTARVVGEGRGC